MQASRRVRIAVFVAAVFAVGLAVASGYAIAEHRERARKVAETRVILARAADALHTVRQGTIVDFFQARAEAAEFSARQAQLENAYFAARLAPTHSAIIDAIVDPFGVPLRLQVSSDSRLELVTLYSCGPDRRDDGGHGDDIAVIDSY